MALPGMIQDGMSPTGIKQTTNVLARGGMGGMPQATAPQMPAPPQAQAGPPATPEGIAQQMPQQPGPPPKQVRPGPSGTLPYMPGEGPATSQVAQGPSPVVPSPNKPQPAEAEQFGALPPAPFGPPHGYQVMASLQNNIRLSGSPSADEIALEAARLLRKSSGDNLLGSDGRAPRAKSGSTAKHGKVNASTPATATTSKQATRATTNETNESLAVIHGNPPKAGGQGIPKLSRFAVAPDQRGADVDLSDVKRTKKVDSCIPPRGKVDIWRQSGKIAIFIPKVSGVKGFPSAESMAGDLEANLARHSSVYKKPRSRGRFGKGYVSQGSRRRKRRTRNRDLENDLLMKGSEKLAAAPPSFSNALSGFGGAKPIPMPSPSPGMFGGSAIKPIPMPSPDLSSMSGFAGRPGVKPIPMPQPSPSMFGAQSPASQMHNTFNVPSIPSVGRTLGAGLTGFAQGIGRGYFGTAQPAGQIGRPPAPSQPPGQPPVQMPQPPQPAVPAPHRPAAPQQAPREPWTGFDEVPDWTMPPPVPKMPPTPQSAEGDTPPPMPGRAPAPLPGAEMPEPQQQPEIPQSSMPPKPAIPPMATPQQLGGTQQFFRDLDFIDAENQPPAPPPQQAATPGFMSHRPYPGQAEDQVVNQVPGSPRLEMPEPSPVGEEPPLFESPQMGNEPYYNADLFSDMAQQIPQVSEPTLNTSLGSEPPGPENLMGAPAGDTGDMGDELDGMQLERPDTATGPEITDMSMPVPRAQVGGAYPGSTQAEPMSDFDRMLAEGPGEPYSPPQEPVVPKGQMITGAPGQELPPALQEVPAPSGPAQGTGTFGKGLSIDTGGQVVPKAPQLAARGGPAVPPRPRARMEMIQTPPPPQQQQPHPFAPQIARAEAALQRAQALPANHRWRDKRIGNITEEINRLKGKTTTPNRIYQDMANKWQASGAPANYDADSLMASADPSTFSGLRRWNMRQKNSSLMEKDAGGFGEAVFGTLGAGLKKLKPGQFFRGQPLPTGAGRGMAMAKSIGGIAGRPAVGAAGGYGGGGLADLATYATTGEDPGLRHWGMLAGGTLGLGRGLGHIGRAGVPAAASKGLMGKLPFWGAMTGGVFGTTADQAKAVGAGLLNSGVDDPRYSTNPLGMMFRGLAGNQVDYMMRDKALQWSQGFVQNLVDKGDITAEQAAELYKNIDRDALAAAAKSGGPMGETFEWGRQLIAGMEPIMKGKISQYGAKLMGDPAFLAKTMTGAGWPPGMQKLIIEGKQMWDNGEYGKLASTVWNAIPPMGRNLIFAGGALGAVGLANMVLGGPKPITALAAAGGAAALGAGTIAALSPQTAQAWTDKFNSLFQSQGPQPGTPEATADQVAATMGPQTVDRAGLTGASGAMDDPMAMAARQGMMIPRTA